MTLSAYYPYQSEAVRERCYAYLDSLAARRWPIVSEERIAPTSFGATFVRISGPPDARPLVLLHGAAATSLMWAPNIEALSAECRTFAVDQVGEFGRSRCIRPAQSLGDQLTWLDELFDALGLRDGVSLMGMSYGGALAAEYALHRPERLEKVVMLAPAATVLRLPIEFWARLLAALFQRRKGLPSFLRWIFADAARLNPQWMEETTEGIFLTMRSLERRWPPIPRVLSDEEWGRFATPALFLVGEHEVIYSAERAVRRLRRVAPTVTAEIIAGAGHDLTIAQAAAVNRRVLAFVRSSVLTGGGRSFRTPAC